jgi:hypothetical protein
VLGSSSAPMSVKGSSTGSANAWRMPLKTGNSFASLSAGNSPPRAPQPVANAWGSVVGNGYAKVRPLSSNRKPRSPAHLALLVAQPPRAVVAPRGEEERALPALSTPTSSAPSRIPTPSLPPPPPVAKKDEDVPDEWDAGLEE